MSAIDNWNWRSINLFREDDQMHYQFNEKEDNEESIKSLEKQNENAIISN